MATGTLAALITMRFSFMILHRLRHARSVSSVVEESKETTQRERGSYSPLI